MKQYPLYPIDYFETFDAFIEGIDAKFGPRRAVSYFTRKQVEVVHTYHELCEDVRALRASLRAKGLIGNHIAIISENCYEWLVAYLAITSSGSVAVCIDAEQSDETIHQMLDMADVENVFVAAPYLPICEEVLSKERIISFDEYVAAEGYLTYTVMVEEGRAMEKERYAIDKDQMAAIVFTSGTSSKAKPVMLTHVNILYNASDAMAFVNTHEKIFTQLPFYHTYGMTCGVLSTLVRGSEAIINGNLRTAMRDMLLSGADTIMTVPLMLEAICNQIWLNAEKQGKEQELRKVMNLVEKLHKMGIHPKIKALEEIREKAFGKIHLVIAGGAAVGNEIERQLECLGLTVLQGYGITECSPLVAVNRNMYKRFGSVGPVLPSFEYKVVEGEIWLKGTSLMAGYYNAPELNAEVMEDGWFKTGDIGHVDSKGFLFITGRKKNLIVFKNGKKVAPEKMEELIMTIPLVKEVVVYGAASGHSADDIKLAATIYPDPERAAGKGSYEVLAELQSAIDAINAKLPFYQHIHMINTRTQPFDKTGTKKIKRHSV